MVETLVRDLGERLAFDSKQNSLLDVLGVDQASSFTDFKKMMISTDTNQFSYANRIVTPLADGTATIQGDRYIVDLYSLSISGRLGNLNAQGYILSVLSLFKGITLQIGSRTFSSADQDIYQQMKLECMDKDTMLSLADGLLSSPFKTDAGASIAVAPTYTSTLARIKLYFQALPNKDWVLPLWCIYPGLLEITDAVLYVNGSQSIKFIMQTTSAVENILVEASAEAGTYNFSEMQLIYYYTQLDAARNDMVLQNSFRMHYMAFTSFKIQAMAATNNLWFSVAPNQKLKSFLFSFPANNSVDKAAPATTAVTIKSGEAGFRGNSLFPAVKITQVKITVGGQEFVYDIPVLAIFDKMSWASTNGVIPRKGSESYGILQKLRQVYSVDLTRLPMDMIGSSSQGIQQVSITVKVDGSAAIGSIDMFIGGHIVAADFGKYSCVGFLEYYDPITLERGVYK